MTTQNLWPGWRTVRQIGAGSFGRVYEIERDEKGVLKKSALKVMSVPPEPGDVHLAYDSGNARTEEEASTYFNSQIQVLLREVDTMEKLKGNRNIVEIQEKKIIPHNGWPGADILIRMELLTPLDTYKRLYPLEEGEVIALGIDICRALEACQSENPPILHRDIKTANIMVDDEGHFKLGDFGVARVMEGTKSAHTKAGTEDYMAPEVLQMRGYYATADIYSLGIVLYRLLNKQRGPFLPTEGLTTASVHDKAREERLSGKKVPPPLIGSDRLKYVVVKALEFEPKNRYQTAAEFRWALETCLGSEEELYDDKNSETVYEEKTRESEQDNLDGKTALGQIRKKPEQDNPGGKTILDKDGVKPEHVEQNKRTILPFIIAAVVLVLVVSLALANRNNSKSNQETKPVDIHTVSSSDNSSEISIRADSTKIKIDETTDLAVIMGEYTIRRDDNLTWKSSDEAVATVDASGVVTAVSAGTVNVTAEYQNHTATIEITVYGSDSDASESADTGKSGNSGNTKPDYGDSIEVSCYTTTLLVGDSVYPSVKSGSWGLDSSSPNLSWSSDNPSIATIDKDGKITGVSQGTVHITGELEGMTDDLEMTIVAVDGGSGASIDVDFESLSLTTGSEDTVNVSFDGEMPTRFGATAYYSEGLSLSLKWGEMQDNRAVLTIRDLFSNKEEGDVSILAYEEDNPTHVVASKKIHIKVNKRSSLW